MKRRKKGAVRRGHGAMCNICGKNCGKGGALKVHIEHTHSISYDSYEACFYGSTTNVVANAWDDSVSTSNGKKVIMHVLVRRFVGHPGPRSVPRVARTPR
jgi:hypothetical protein